jgi:hypothetical protein
VTTRAKVSDVLPTAIAGGLAALAVLAGWRGSDLSAQVFRADLFRKHGFVLWNAQWFGGHATLSYSVLSPVLSALVGPVMLAAVSGLASAAIFHRIMRRHFGAAAQAGSVWFAAGTTANLVVGRVPFALGLAFGLAAVLALQRERSGLAAVAGLLSALASPVAGLFVVIAAAAWALSTPEHRMAGAAVVMTALLPLAAATALFPGAGSFPYEPWAFVWDLVLAALFFAIVGAQNRTLQWGAALYAITAVAAFAVPSALGGNLSRLSQFFAGPILACVLWQRRKALLAMLVVPLLCWQWAPALEGIASAHEDPSTSRAYYQPLVRYVTAQDQVPGRLEIPFTRQHWEAAYVADAVPLARGWERQLDLTYDHIFYDGSLNAASYEQWLADDAVEFVALPDAPLDDSSVAERRLLLSGLPYLEPVWRDQHWQVWRVMGYHGLVDGPATVIHQDPTGFTLRVDASGDVTLRARASSHWALDQPGCARADAHGWTRLQGLRPGVVHVTQAWRGSPCP